MAFVQRQMTHRVRDGQCQIKEPLSVRKGFEPRVVLFKKGVIRNGGRSSRRFPHSFCRNNFAFANYGPETEQGRRW